MQLVQLANTSGVRLVGDRSMRGAFAKSPRCSGSVACVAEQHTLQPAAQVAEHRALDVKTQSQLSGKTKAPG